MDVARANDLLRKVGEDAFQDETLRPLLLDAPTVMGVESFEVDQVNLRMVARTLPGKQFDVARELRTSTLLLSLLFVAVFALYLEVRPPPAGGASSSNGAGGSAPAGTRPEATSSVTPTTQSTSTSETTSPSRSTTSTSRAATTRSTASTSTTAGATGTSAPSHSTAQP